MTSEFKKRILQSLIEAIIPLAGFFLWNWSLYFICLYYLLDLLAREVLIHFKAKARIKFNPEEQSLLWFKYGFTSAFLLLLIISISFAFFRLYHPQINFQKESLSFWNYRDLGLPQGYFLLPFIALVSYLQYKQEYLLPAKYRVLSLKTLWQQHIKALLLLLGFIGLACGVVVLIKDIPEIVFILSIIVFTAVWNLKLN